MLSFLSGNTTVYLNGRKKLVRERTQVRHLLRGDQELLAAVARGHVGVFTNSGDLVPLDYEVNHGEHLFVKAF